MAFQHLSNNPSIRLSVNFLLTKPELSTLEYYFLGESFNSFDSFYSVLLILVFLSREVTTVRLMLVSNSSITEIAAGSAFERKCIHSKYIPDCLFYKCWSSCSRLYFSKASHLAEELKNRKKNPLLNIKWQIQHFMKMTLKMNFLCSHRYHKIQGTMSRLTWPCLKYPQGNCTAKLVPGSQFPFPLVPPETYRSEQELNAKRNERWIPFACSSLKSACMKTPPSLRECETRFWSLLPCLGPSFTFEKAWGYLSFSCACFYVAHSSFWKLWIMRMGKSPLFPLASNSQRGKVTACPRLPLAYLCWAPQRSSLLPIPSPCLEGVWSKVQNPILSSTRNLREQYMP